MNKDNFNFLKNKESGFIKEVILVLGILIGVKYFWNIDVVGKLEIPVEKAVVWVMAKFK